MEIRQQYYDYRNNDARSALLLLGLSIAFVNASAALVADLKQQRRSGFVSVTRMIGCRYVEVVCKCQFRKCF